MTGGVCVQVAQLCFCCCGCAVCVAGGILWMRLLREHPAVTDGSHQSGTGWCEHGSTGCICVGRGPGIYEGDACFAPSLVDHKTEQHRAPWAFPCSCAEGTRRNRRDSHRMYPRPCTFHTSSAANNGIRGIAPSCRRILHGTEACSARCARPLLSVRVIYHIRDIIEYDSE